MPTGTEVEVGLPNASLGSVDAISLALEKSVCRTTLILVMIARYSLYNISCLSKAWKQFCEDHAAGHYDVASKSGEFLRKFLTATLPNDLQ